MTTFDFALEIGLSAAGSYPVITRAPSGEVSTTLQMSLTPDELDHQLVVIRDSVLTGDEQPVRKLGQRLFDALIADDVRVLYMASRQRARKNGEVLRLVLWVRPPELARLPWEFLFDPGRQDYLDLTVPVVRYLEVLGLAADVLVTAEISAQEEQAIVEAFRALDVAAHTRMVPTRRGLEQLHWLVLAALPLHAFLSGLGSAAAADVAQGLKRLVGRVVGAKHKTALSEQVLVLQDTTTRLQIVLEADLPAEAYQALVALDLSAFRQGPVHYDRQHGRWRSELDEWQQRQVKDPGPA